MRPAFLGLLAAACAVAPVTATTNSTSPSPTTTLATDVVDPTEPDSGGLPCGPPLFAPAQLPDRVTAETPRPSAVDVDIWTAQPGTFLAIWTDADGGPVVALVRGALPPVRWSSTPTVIDVRGVPGALGPLQDGMWAAAWFEGPDRCDDYTLYLYPPTSEAEARAVAESIVP